MKQPPPLPTFPQVLLVTPLPPLLLHLNDETFVATAKVFFTFPMKLLLPQRFFDFPDETFVATE